ncbi:MAG TPA: hypothetical protein VMD29_02845 [Terracidiphilus sp.]|nr:hypothetical protein [Terracidiphilus sp.]
MMISWKDRDSDLKWPLSTEKKIDIFYQQTLGWQLHVADLLSNGGEELGNGRKVACIHHSGFAVLQICLSYLETIGKCRALANGDGANFRAGAKDVCPELAEFPKSECESLLDVLYHDARCGLYHNSRTRGVGLGQPQDGKALAFDPEARKLVIDPKRLPKVLKAHLERYRTALLDPKNVTARQHFVRWFDNNFGRS